MDDELLEDEQQEQQQDTAKEQGDKSPEAARLAKLEADLGRLQTSLRETEENARYWHQEAQKASRGAGASRQEAAPAKPTIDIVEALTSKDPALIRAALKEYGAIDKSEVEAIVRQTKDEVLSSERQARAEEKLYADFPELRDANSEFFAATKRNYQEILAEDPGMKNSPAAMRSAARLAKSELGGRETEDQRAERTARQSGGRPGGGNRQQRTEADTFDAGAQEIMARLVAAGAQINPESYKKRVAAAAATKGKR